MSMFTGTRELCLFYLGRGVSRSSFLRVPRPSRSAFWSERAGRSKSLHSFCEAVHIRYNLGMFRLLCITAHPGDAKSDQELAEVRKREFAASCEILRVSQPVILDYPDGQLYRQELNRVVYE